MQTPLPSRLASTFAPGRIRPPRARSPWRRGKPVIEAKYTGLHAFRHFYASWLINARQDRGQELPAKVVQTRLGHASIVMTFDIYGHVFPRGDDRDQLAAAEKALLA
jgi:integrase